MFVFGMEPTKIGGIENFLRHLVVRLNDLGWDSVLCFDGVISPQYLDFFDYSFVRLEVIAHQENLGIGAARALWALMRRERPEIFVYAFHSPMRVFPWIARLSGCKKIFFNDHSSRGPNVVPAPLPFVKRLIGRVLTTPITAIVSVAEFTKRSQTLFGISKAPNLVITNGIDIQEPNATAGALIRSRFGIPAEAVVIGQVCWMVPVKGVDVMLRAAKRVLSIAPATRFLFVGGGADLETYVELSCSMDLEKSVTFTGILNDPLGSGVFDAFDIYAQPSRWQEACPLAVLEAMSKKLPVVASATGGLPELITEGETGYLFPVGDDESLASILQGLIADANLRERMGEAALASVLSTHQLENTISRYLEVFLHD